MYVQEKNYHKINEILYALHSVEDTSGIPVSKILLQKLLYLAASLAPIKDVVLSFLRFTRIQRGPYSSEIQNIVDHLVACGLVQIVDFRVIQDKNSVGFYRITESGKRAVSFLSRYSVEEEKFWWIRSVTKLAYIFSSDEAMKKSEEYEGLDRVVHLVYQDFTFKDAKETRFFRALIDFSDQDGKTNQLIQLIKDYLHNNAAMFTRVDERKQAELILLGFFEEYFANYLEQQK
jgi:uncharacterized protein YwgA